MKGVAVSTEGLLGYTEMDGVLLTHIAAVRAGGEPWHLSLKPVCHQIVSRARIQLGAVDEDWKRGEAKFATAVEAMQEWRHEFGLCPKCRVRIDVLARREQEDL